MSKLVSVVERMARLQLFHACAQCVFDAICHTMSVDRPSRRGQPIPHQHRDIHPPSQKGAETPTKIRSTPVIRHNPENSPIPSLVVLTLTDLPRMRYGCEDWRTVSTHSCRYYGTGDAVVCCSGRDPVHKPRLTLAVQRDPQFRWKPCSRIRTHT